MASTLNRGQETCEQERCAGEHHCSEFGADCWGVPNPLACWLGGTRIILGEICETPIADGYCPVLRATIRDTTRTK